MNKSIYLFIILQISFYSYADFEFPNDTLVIIDSTHNYKIVSKPDSSYDEVKGNTSIFKTNDTLITFLYDFNWYSQRIYHTVVNDTLFLIRLHVWHRSWKYSENEFEIGFYKGKEVLREYHVKDIVKDSTKISRSVSHFETIKKINGIKKKWSLFRSGRKVFQIISTENKKINFDILTGEIVK